MTIGTGLVGLMLICTVICFVLALRGYGDKQSPTIARLLDWKDLK